MAQIDWHSGFDGGPHLSLREYKDDLDIEREHYITDEPTKIDELVIKKKPGVLIDNAIGRAFRQFNLIEYKSPDDELNIDVVWKAIGYGGLYKGYGGTVNAIPYEEMTITVLRSRKPVGLFRYLEEKDGYRITEADPGVYRISGMIDMVVQIVVIKELKEHVFLPLRIMVRDADEEEIKAFLKEILTYDIPEDRNNANAVLNISSEANEDAFIRIRRDEEMGDALRRVMKDDLMESELRGEARGVERGVAIGEAKGEKNAKRQMILNLLKNGVDESIIADSAEVTVEYVVQIKNGEVKII